MDALSCDGGRHYFGTSTWGNYVDPSNLEPIGDPLTLMDSICTCGQLILSMRHNSHFGITGPDSTRTVCIVGAQ